MKIDGFTDIRSITDFPGFHDAELIGLAHDPRDRSLELRFRRITGEVETFRFSGVVSQRMIDFASQNVVSRLLISPAYPFTSAEIGTWVQWMRSRDDSKDAGIDEPQCGEFAKDLLAGRRSLFVLEPSCGAELAVLCESISLKT